MHDQINGFANSAPAIAGPVRGCSEAKRASDQTLITLSTGIIATIATDASATPSESNKLADRTSATNVFQRVAPCMIEVNAGPPIA